VTRLSRTWGYGPKKDIFRQLMAGWEMTDAVGCAVG
jgi:hypothetical protein